MYLAASTSPLTERFPSSLELGKPVYVEAFVQTFQGITALSQALVTRPHLHNFELYVSILIYSHLSQYIAVLFCMYMHLFFLDFSYVSNVSGNIFCSVLTLIFHWAGQAAVRDDCKTPY